MSTPRLHYDQDFGNKVVVMPVLLDSSPRSGCRISLVLGCCLSLYESGTASGGGGGGLAYLALSGEGCQGSGKGVREDGVLFSDLLRFAEGIGEVGAASLRALSEPPAKVAVPPFV